VPLRFDRRELRLERLRLRLERERQRLQFAQIAFERIAVGTRRALERTLQLADSWPDLLAHAILLGAQGFEFGQDPATLLVERNQAFEGNLDALTSRPFDEALRILAKGLHIDHGADTLPAPTLRRRQLR